MLKKLLFCFRMLPAVPMDRAFEVWGQAPQAVNGRLRLMSFLTAFACSSFGAPIITSVTPISTQQLQSIVITGSGFGTQNAYTGNSAYIALFDLTNGSWQAGNIGSLEGVYENDWVTLIVNSWTDSKIVLGGFSGSWGQNSLGETPSGNWTLRVGDQELIEVWNAQSGAGPATISTTVGSTAGAPEPGQLSLLAMGVTILLTLRRRGETRVSASRQG
jgi:hypothetical protein